MHPVVTREYAILCKFLDATSNSKSRKSAVKTKITFRIELVYQCSRIAMSSRERSGRGWKRSSESSGRDNSTRDKRARHAVQRIEDFSELEQTILKAAAKILNIPVERVLAAATDNIKSSSSVDSTTASSETLPTPSTPDERSPAATMGSTSESSQQADDGQTVNTESDSSRFELRLPNINIRRRTRPLARTGRTGGEIHEATLSRSDSLSIALDFNASQGSPVLPWLQDSFGLNPPLGLESFSLDDPEFLATAPDGLDASASLSTQLPQNVFSDLVPDLIVTEVNGFTRSGSLSTSALQGLEQRDVTNSEVVKPDDIKDVDRPEQPGRTSSFEDTHAKSMIQYRKVTQKARGPFSDSEQQKQTTLTRRLGACIRCSIQRIRVSFPI